MSAGGIAGSESPSVAADSALSASLSNDPLSMDFMDFEKLAEQIIGGDFTFIKSSIVSNSNLTSNQRMMVEDVLAAHVASSLCQSFNKRPDGSSPMVKRPLHFQIPYLLSIAGTSRYHRNQRVGDYVVIEDFIPGRYERFVSNNGTLLFQGTLGSFSHFTYHESKGKLIVVDLQGVRNDASYMLTDPAIHTAGVGKIFGELDLGDTGIDAFFMTHECCGLCRGLLEPPRHLKKWDAREKLMMTSGNFDPTKTMKTKEMITK